MQKQNGNTLLEILLVLAVSSALIVLAIRYFTIVDLNIRVAEAISKIDIVSRASYEWLTAERKQDFSGITTSELNKGGYLSLYDAKSPWGGNIHVTPSENKQHVTLTIAGITTHACEELRHHLFAISYGEISKQNCHLNNTGSSVSYWGEF